MTRLVKVQGHKVLQVVGKSVEIGNGCDRIVSKHYFGRLYGVDNVVRQLVAYIGHIGQLRIWCRHHQIYSLPVNTIFKLFLYVLPVTTTGSLQHYCRSYSILHRCSVTTQEEYRLRHTFDHDHVDVDGADGRLRKSFSLL